MTEILFHGGVGGLWPGNMILPDMAHGRYVDGCADCEAHRRGEHGTDPLTPAGWVYASTDRPYARYYASRAVKGWLYEVELMGDVERSEEDLFPSWRARSAKVIRVIEKRVTLTMDERRALFVRWGGTEEEFRHMVNGIRWGIPSRKSGVTA